MAGRRLTRWQKASAVVPVALIVGAWGAAIAGPQVTSASSSQDGSDPGVPEVPSTPFEQPASIQAPNTTPPGVDPRAGAPGTLSTLSTSGIPSAALLAYKRTETLLASADASCKLPWSLVAAIGRVESNHGRFGGNRVGADGVSRPGIYGIPLDGSNNTARITDTDSGALDNDKVYDRAVGPMQFIPATWNSIAVDSNNDGAKNPQDVNDASLAAGVYLCAGDGDLSARPGASAAVLRYNRSQDYVDLVLAIADRYAKGDFSEAPNNVLSTPSIVNRQNDQTLTPKQRAAAKTKTKKRNQDRAGSSGGSTGSTAPGASSGGGSTGGSGSGGGSSDGGGSGGSGSGVGSSDDDSSSGSGGSGDVADIPDVIKKPVKDTVDEVVGGVGDVVDGATDPLPPPVAEPVQDLWSRAEATVYCTTNQPLNVLGCVGNLVGTPQG
ncbi:MAG: lytic transglycosylase domain-containing protein [Nocardioidaceae bacterium]|nr:lytic transglycosylase domain-containing protein [Nocardioidaceae bacterium]